MKRNISSDVSSTTTPAGSSSKMPKLGSVDYSSELALVLHQDLASDDLLEIILDEDQLWCYAIGKLLFDLPQLSELKIKNLLAQKMEATMTRNSEILVEMANGSLSAEEHQRLTAFREMFRDFEAELSKTTNFIVERPLDLSQLKVLFRPEQVPKDVFVPDPEDGTHQLRLHDVYAGWRPTMKGFTTLVQQMATQLVFSTLPLELIPNYSDSASPKGGNKTYNPTIVHTAVGTLGQTLEILNPPEGVSAEMTAHHFATTFTRQIRVVLNTKRSESKKFGRVTVPTNIKSNELPRYKVETSNSGEVMVEEQVIGSDDVMEQVAEDQHY